MDFPPPRSDRRFPPVFFDQNPPGGSPWSLERPACPWEVGPKKPVRFVFFPKKTKMLTENGWLEDEDFPFGKGQIFGGRVYLVFSLV